MGMPFPLRSPAGSDGLSPPAAVPSPALAAAGRRRRDMDACLQDVRRELGASLAVGAYVAGAEECWTALRRDAIPGCRAADWIVAGSWQEMLWLARRELDLHPVPADRRAEYRDDLLERLAAKRTGWAVIRLLGDGDLLLARRGHVEAGPCPQVAMSAEMGQAVAEAVSESAVRPCYRWA